MDDVELAFRLQEESEKIRTEVRAKVREKVHHEDILIFIETLTELNQPKEKILKILVRSMDITESEARDYYQEAMAKKD